MGNELHDGLAAPADRRRVLIVDDDAQIRALLRQMYERDEWSVEEAGCGREALRSLFDRRPQAVVLDVDMPRMDGWTTLERIREVSDVPVLMLTGTSTELDKVRALRAGADDYVTKPFGSMELMARTEAIVRRSPDCGTMRAGYDDGAIEVDYERHLVRADGREVVLTPQEFRLLVAFLEHPGHVLGWVQLLSLAWSQGVGTRDQVKIYVGYLRRKLGRAMDIETVRGFGYRFRPAAAPRRAA